MGMSYDMQEEYTFGINLYNTATNSLVENNTVNSTYSKVYGILVDYNSSYNNISYNNVTLQGADSVGMYINYSSYFNTLKSNQVVVNGTGYLLDNSANTTIIGEFNNTIGLLNTSSFNYSYNGSIWMETNSTESDTNITRTVYSWTQENITFYEVTLGEMTYVLEHLTGSGVYTVSFNGTSLGQFTADPAGNLSINYPTRQSGLVEIIQIRLCWRRGRKVVAGYLLFAVMVGVK